MANPKWFDIVQLSGSVDLSDAVMSNGSLTLPEGA